MNEKMIERADRLNKMLAEQEKEFEIRCSRTFKNNRTQMSYLLYSPLFNAAPNVYYSEEWWNKPDEEVVEYLDEIFQQNKLNIDSEKYTSRSYILTHVLPRLVSESNTVALDDNGILHKPFLDMQILFYIPLEDFHAQEGIATSTLKKEMIKYAGISRDELYRNAIQNLEASYEIKTMCTMLNEIMGKEVFDEEDRKEDFMWVFTNKIRFFGAACILNKNILAEIKEKIGSDFVILPSSVHECIALPYWEQNPEKLREMVREVNETEVNDEDVLTNNVYIYRNGSVSIL